MIMCYNFFVGMCSRCSELIQKRTGFMVGCIEEIAYNNGWITKEKLLELAHNLRKTDYGKYLMEIAQDHAF